MTKHSFLAEVTFKCTLYTRNDHLDYKREQEIITDRKPFFYSACALRCTGFTLTGFTLATSSAKFSA